MSKQLEIRRRTEEIIRLVCENGWTNEEIAMTLGVSIKTVERTMTELMRRNGVSSRYELQKLYQKVEEDARKALQQNETVEFLASKAEELESYLEESGLQPRPVFSPENP